MAAETKRPRLGALHSVEAGLHMHQRAQAKRDRNGFSDNADDDYEPDFSAGNEDLSHLSPMGRGRASGAGEGPRRSGSSVGSTSAARRLPLTIEGELVAKSTGTVSAFSVGDRVFHQKFGNGNITNIDGNKLTILFDRAGEKRVVDSFVERV